MSERVNRDRPAANPGGMQCERCDEIFIGEEWHACCAICLEKLQQRQAALKTAKGKSDEQ